MDNNVENVDRNQTGEPQGPTNWFLKLLLMIFVVPTVIVGEGTKSLFRHAYRDAHWSSIFIGSVLSLAAGVAVGHQMGWVGEAATWKWLLSGIATSAAVFVYGWTAIYRVFMHWAFKLSDWLWTFVSDGESSRRGISSWLLSRGRAREDNGTNPVWFSRLLMFFAWAGLVVAVIGIEIEAAKFVAGHEAWFGWLGAVLFIVVAIAAVVLFFGALYNIGVLGTLFIGALLAAIAYFFFGGWLLNAWQGALNCFGEGSWGNWGYVTGALLGLVVAVPSAIGGTLLVGNGRMRTVAVALSAVGIYFLAPQTQALIGTYETGALAYFSLVLPWVAYAIQMVVFAGILFPLVHIAVSHGLAKLESIPKLMAEAYESGNAFAQAVMYAVSIVVAGYVTYAFTGTISEFLPFAGASWQFYATGALLAYITYLVATPLLVAVGPFALAVAAAYAAYNYTGAYFEQTWLAIGSIVVTIVAAFPLLFSAVRAIVPEGVATSLRDAGKNAHKRVGRVVLDVLEQVVHASRNAYGDSSPYRDFFLHAVNIAATVLLVIGVSYASDYLGLEGYLAYGAMALVALFSYVFIGRLWLRGEVAGVGFVVALLACVPFGVYTHAHQPYGMVVSVIGGLIGGAVTFGLLFPVAYIVVRAVLSAVKAEVWLGRPLARAQNLCWNALSGFRREFGRLYRQVRDEMTRLRENFAKQYKQTAAGLRRKKD